MEEYLKIFKKLFKFRCMIVKTKFYIGVINELFESISNT